MQCVGNLSVCLAIYVHLLICRSQPWPTSMQLAQTKDLLSVMKMFASCAVASHLQCIECNGVEDS